MRTSRSTSLLWLWLWMALLTILVTPRIGPGPAGTARAETEPTSPVATASDASQSATRAADATRQAPVYAPPRRGRPRARVGGGVRANGPKLPTLRALVPAHVAHTARDQPTLLWYVSDVPPPEAALLFSLTSEDEIDPLIRAEIARPSKPGLQRIDLSSYDFKLETGKEYEWSVALVPDRNSRARDLVILGWIERVDEVALGWIERVDRPEEPTATGPDAATLAAAGLWYDAVEVADQEERAALLDQIGLASAELR